MDRDDEISVQDLKSKLDNHEPVFVLDVREEEEFRICNIGGTLIPMGVVPLRLSELDPAREIAVLCHHGNRSRAVVNFLLQKGFTRARNVTGGIEEWARSIDPAMRRY